MTHGLSEYEARRRSQDLTNASLFPYLLRRFGEEAVRVMVKPSACEVGRGVFMIIIHFHLLLFFCFTDGVMLLPEFVGI